MAKRVKQAEGTLEDLLAFLLCGLEELKEVADDTDRQFQYGLKTAFVGCLEYLSSWEKAREYGLDFDVEERFPL